MEAPLQLVQGSVHPSQTPEGAANAEATLREREVRAAKCMRSCARAYLQGRVCVRALCAPSFGCMRCCFAWPDAALVAQPAALNYRGRMVCAHGVRAAAWGKDSSVGLEQRRLQERGPRCQAGPIHHPSARAWPEQTSVRLEHDHCQPLSAHGPAEGSIAWVQ